MKRICEKSTFGIEHTLQQGGWRFRQLMRSGGPREVEALFGQFQTARDSPKEVPHQTHGARDNRDFPACKESAEDDLEHEAFEEEKPAEGFAQARNGVVV